MAQSEGKEKDAQEFDEAKSRQPRKKPWIVILVIALAACGAGLAL